MNNQEKDKGCRQTKQKGSVSACSFFVIMLASALLEGIQHLYWGLPCNDISTGIREEQDNKYKCTNKADLLSFY